MFNEFSRILKKGGVILISTPYCGFFKNLAIAIINFELVYDPLGPHIRYYTRKSLENCLNLIGFRTLHFGVFGRFFPLSKGMYVLAKKGKNKLMKFEKYCV
jgi:2-polyprenyl-6-hydroxyphenyl methylase/3-demethylubiquinone-9 3-methyltransferase